MKNITFYYDYICPFCYVGTKRMLQIADEFELEIDWKGIEIHPGYSPEGKKRKKTQRSEHLARTLKEITDVDNTDIKLPGFITNSRLCLEASEFAKSRGKFVDFHITAFDYFFKQKENIGKIETVLNIGKIAGLNTTDLEDCLKSRSMREQIEENKKSADEKIVVGVPTVYFNEFRVHGVQSPEVYRDIIKKHLLN